jgi:hypothetical protein
VDGAAAAFPQTDGADAFVCVQRDNDLGPEPAPSLVAGASTLFVSTAPGTDTCGMFCAGGAGACGVMAVGVTDGIGTLSGPERFNVGETGGCATLVGGSTSLGAVCEKAWGATTVPITAITTIFAHGIFISS